MSLNSNRQSQEALTDGLQRNPVLTALYNRQHLHQSTQNGFLSSILSQRSLPLLASTSAFNPNHVESSKPRSINTGVKFVKIFHGHPSNPNDDEITINPVNSLPTITSISSHRVDSPLTQQFHTFAATIGHHSQHYDCKETLS